ncbi:ParA family partition ATPase [Limibacillus halophilus]|uniref:Chromosome partitioning protein n=1 Tax=Limibacillus halophilus TaxID=1579333 RepID=A0A839ST00_9PROT|nr:ParA family partition ATPase [Limibacillus halophilus]MBB3065931.1 chromosome partitioning protein [Limibacillus halophilus]
MTATVITVAQQKGGAGKTTLAAHLAVAFTRVGKKVAVVDIDPQQSLTMWYRLREQQLGDAGAGLLVNQVKGWRTRNEVDKLAASHDVVLIDSPPHAETEARVAVRAADLVVIPVQPSPMDVWATRPTLEMAAGEKVPVLLVLNRVPPRANLTDEMLAEMKAFGAQVAKSRVGNRVVFAAALAEGRAVNEVQPSSKAAKEIAALAKEILKAARV